MQDTPLRPPPWATKTRGPPHPTLSSKTACHHPSLGAPEKLAGTLFIHYYIPFPSLNSLPTDENIGWRKRWRMEEMDVTLNRSPSKLKMVECKQLLGCKDTEWSEIGAIVLSLNLKMLMIV